MVTRQRPAVVNPISDCGPRADDPALSAVESPQAVFSSRLFWKLFGVYALLSALSTLSIISILGHRQREVVYVQVYRRLHDSAVTVLNLIDNPFAHRQTAGFAKSLRKIATDNNTRITLLAVDGEVQAASGNVQSKSMLVEGRKPCLVKGRI